MPKRSSKAAGLPEEPAAVQNEASGTSSDSAVSDGSDGSGSDGDAVSGGSDTSMEEEVEVDIQFFDPKERDFHGIKALLQDLLGGAEFNVSQLADTIIAQASVGTVVKSGEDEEPIAVTTALSLQRYASLEVMQQIRAHLVQSAPSEKKRNQLAAAFTEKGTAVMVNERVVNCPPQVSPPLMTALFDEISWATEDEPTEELRESFKLSQFLVVCAAYQDPLTTSSAKDQKPPKKKHKAASALVYSKPEDEYFHKHASWFFTFSTPKQGPAAEELQPIRLVMLVTNDQVKAARQELDEVVGNAALEAAEAGLDQE